MPKISCPQCTAKLNVPDSALGKNGRCPKCQTKFIVQLPLAVDEYDLAPLHLPVTGPTVLPHVPAASPTFSAKPSFPTRRDNEDSEGESTRRPIWFIPAIAGGGVLSLLLVVGMLLLVSRLLGMGSAFGSRSGRIDLSRDPERGDYSWVPYASAADADPATWKVKVDGVAPPKDLKSALPLPGGRDIENVYFSSPTGARAAAFEQLGYGLKWVQYDLRQTDPVGEAILFKEASELRSRSPLVVALSPSGQRMAIRSPYAATGEVFVFATDGSQVAKISSTTNLEEVIGVNLPTDNLLLVTASDKLIAYKLPDGDVAYEISGVEQPPSLSPGGKWLAVLTANGIAWHETASGEQAGLSPLPAKWFEQDTSRGATDISWYKRDARANFSYDGKWATVIAVNPHGDAHFAVIDVSSGKVEQQFVMRYLVTQATPKTSAIWAGPRQVLLSTGMVVDLDLKTWVAKYKVGYWPGQSPDGRYWRIHAIPYQQMEKVFLRMGTKDQETVKRGANRLLAATTLPTADVTEQLAQAQQGLVWHPGKDVRLEVAGILPEEEREKTVEEFARVVASRGYRITPKAKYAIRMNIGVDDGMVVGKVEPSYNPNYVTEHYEQGKVGNVRVSVVDDHGEPQLATQGNSETGSTYRAGGEQRVWQDLRSRFKGLQFPRFYLRDASGKRLEQSMEKHDGVPIGIDGILEAPPYTHTPHDSFALPKDRGF